VWPKNAPLANRFVSVATAFRTEAKGRQAVRIEKLFLKFLTQLAEQRASLCTAFAAVRRPLPLKFAQPEKFDSAEECATSDQECQGNL
jgi:hypothetical protein